MFSSTIRYFLFQRSLRQLATKGMPSSTPQRFMQGITLIELVLAITVAAIVALMAFNRYQDYVIKNNVATINNSVTLIMDAMTKYYYEHCGPTRFPGTGTVSVTFDDLEDYIGNLDKIHNPLNPQAEDNSRSSFSMLFLPQPAVLARRDLKTQEWVMQVEMSLPANERALYYALLGAQAERNNSLIWQQNVQAYAKENLTGFMPFHAGLRQFSIENYVTPALPQFRDPNTRNKESQTPCGIIDTKGTF